LKRVSRNKLKPFPILGNEKKNLAGDAAVKMSSVGTRKTISKGLNARIPDKSD
jgi:hypothetical protein